MFETYEPTDHYAEMDAERQRQRNAVIRAALWLSGLPCNDRNVDDVRSDIIDRCAPNEDIDHRIVITINPEYLRGVLKRKLDERNREQFQDELAARVWATVKEMTWFTDEQKVIPMDLGDRVRAKGIDEAQDLQRLRDQLRG